MQVTLQKPIFNQSEGIAPQSKWPQGESHCSLRTDFEVFQLFGHNSFQYRVQWTLDQPELTDYNIKAAEKSTR